MSLDSHYRPDWDAIAQHLVSRSLRLRPGERVVYSVDPYLHPELVDAVRDAVLEAGAIEQASMLQWTPRLAGRRGVRGVNADPAAARREDRAHLELFATADVFIWLPHDIFRPGSVTALHTEWILSRWRGRGLHFHWFPDFGTDPANPLHSAIFRMYERAILELDYSAHAARQRKLVDAIRGKQLHLTTPDGTDLRFKLEAEGWYHLNDGDASHDKSLRATCARDREEELPCGAVRTIPRPDSATGIVSFRRGQTTRGHGCDLGRFTTHLDLVFQNGRITELRAGDKQAEADLLWQAQTGDRDRLSEVVFGTNPLLQALPEAHLPPYWGFGEGVARLHLGDNTESGGSFESSQISELFITDATIDVDGEPLIVDGKLLISM